MFFDKFWILFFPGGMCQALWSFFLVSAPHCTIGINFPACKGRAVPCYGWVVTAQLLTFPPAVTPSTCCQVALEEHPSDFLPLKTSKPPYSPSPFFLLNVPLVCINRGKCWVASTTGKKEFRSKGGSSMARAGRSSPMPCPGIWADTQAANTPTRRQVCDHPAWVSVGMPAPSVIISILYNHQATVLRSCQR